MSTVTALPAEERARAILAEVDAAWPEPPGLSLIWARTQLLRALDDCNDLAAGRLHPSRIQPTDLDAGLPEEHAPEWAADTAEQCAVILRDRLAAAMRDESNSSKGEAR